MKKLIKNSFVVVAFVILTAQVFAGEPYIRVKQKGSKEFFLFIDNADINKDGTIITLKNLRGFELYNEKLKNQKDYTKVYDVEALPKGKYILEIADDLNLQSWTLEISKEGIQLNKMPQSEVIIASDK